MRRRGSPDEWRNLLCDAVMRDGAVAGVFRRALATAELCILAEGLSNYTPTILLAVLQIYYWLYRNALFALQVPVVRPNVHRALINPGAK